MNDNQSLIDNYNKANKGTNKVNTPTNKAYPPKVSYMEVKKPGIYKFRLFPNRDNPLNVAYEELTRHFLPTVLSNGKTVNLPYFCNGKGCETCALYNKKTAKGDQDAWKYKADKRFAYYGLNERSEESYITMNYYQNDELTKKIVGNLKANVNVTDFNTGRWIELEVRVTKDGKWVTIISIGEEHSLTHIQRSKFLELKNLKDMVTKISNEEMADLLFPERKKAQAEQKNKPDQSTQQPAKSKDGLPAVKSDEDMKKIREQMLKDARNESEIVDAVTLDMSIFDDLSAQNNKEEDSKNKPVLKTKINDSIWDN